MVDSRIRIIQVLSDICDRYERYKITLDCAETNVRFYEKCGFARKEVQMTRYNQKVIERGIVPKL